MDFIDEIRALQKQAQDNSSNLNKRLNCENNYENEESLGGFFLRTAFSLLIFCSFLWLEHENRTIVGVTTTNVQEVISTSVILQDMDISDTIHLDFIKS